jgi:hypothetical protein
MNITLWIGQILLAFVCMVSGSMKSTQSRERMIETGQSAAKIVPLPFMRTAGVTELFAVLGLILPWATGVAPVLTPVAAAGFGVVWSSPRPSIRDSVSRRRWRRTSVCSPCACSSQ